MLTSSRLSGPSFTVGRRPILATPRRHAAVRQPHRHRVDAARRLQMAAQRDVGGRESRSCGRACRHAPPAADRPGPAELGGGALRVAVLQQRAGCGWRRAAPRRRPAAAPGSAPCRAASARRAGSVSPPRRWPNAKSGPQTRCRAPRPPCSTSVDEVLGRHQAELMVERQLVEQRDAERRERVGPLGRQRQAERRVVRAEHARADAARRSARRAAPSGRAACAARITCAWPRCTPSKLPSATVAPRASAGSPRQSWKIRITAARAPARRPRRRSPPRRRTVQTVLSVARFLSALSAVTVAVALTVSPIFTGAAEP